MRLYFFLTFAVLFTENVFGTVEEEKELLNEQDVEGRINNEEETLRTIRLNQISHVVRPKNIIEITLPRENFPEDCYVTPPGGHLIKTNLLSMEGVNVQDKNDVVSCRVTIGPIVQNLLGNWDLCGRSTSANVMRCQIITIIWDNSPIVITTVEKNLSTVLLTCSVPAAYEVHACKFRDPRGNTLVAAHGVGQDEYMSNGPVVNFKSDAHAHNCTFSLINPPARDLGIWRCGLNTSTATLYGFLTVMYPHLMQDPEVAAAVSEPELESSSLSYLEGDAVTLTCFVPSAISYCYFRARNGTVYNVFPKMSSSQNFEYVGAGLDAGECGIRFRKFSASEAGRWSCHVGLVNATTPELWTDVYADVIAKIRVGHYWSVPNVVAVQADVYDMQDIEYCRFIRINGEGFTSNNLPDRYEVETYKGYCILRIRDPDVLDLQQWTVVAKLKTEDGELSRKTAENLLILPMYSRSVFPHTSLWILISVICLLCIIATSAFVPKKNRERTYERVS